MQVYKCMWCGKHLFEDGDLRQPRSDKKFCKAAHRVAFHRWLKNIDREKRAMARATARLAGYLNYPPAQESAIQALIGAKTDIEAELRIAGVRTVR